MVSSRLLPRSPTLIGSSGDTVVTSLTELLILRHAKSSWSDPDLADFDRPLKGRGRRDCIKIGRYLNAFNLAPDYILSSTAVRAKDTTQRVLSEPGWNEIPVDWRDELYHAGPSIWLSALASCPEDARRVMIVGHNPGLEDLLISLNRERIPVPDDGKLLPTATLAVLKIAGAWSDIRPGHAQLEKLVRPRSCPISVDPLHKENVLSESNASSTTPTTEQETSQAPASPENTAKTDESAEAAPTRKAKTSRRAEP